MSTISLCMIVKDEEKIIGRCLDCVKDLVDEIIIVDTGSTDMTKEIVKEYTSKIYDFKWIDDFSAARNYSFSKATMDYIFWLDADDILLEEDRAKFKRVKELLNPSIDVVMMKYNLGVDENGKPTMTFFRERLLKRSKNYKWYDRVHEYMVFDGKIVNSDVCITHKSVHGRTDRNLKIFEKMISEGHELTNRNYFYFARELFFNERYDDAIEYYNKFLETEDGYLSNYIDSCIDLYKCYKVKNNGKMMLNSLFRSFEYDTPRGEICCYIGFYYKKKKDYDKAIFWFELATKLKKPDSKWGFVIHDMWGFIPCVELSICHFEIGNIEEAIRFNEKASIYKPNHPAVLKNREFLKSLSKSKFIE